MPDFKIIECPRDAWQGLAGQIPTDAKTGYLRALISAGFKHIDAVSFVSPKAVPQMADSEDVLKKLDVPEDVEIIGIVVNEKGADRAIATGKVKTLGFPYSVSQTFLQRNQNQTCEEALEVLERIQNKATAASLDLVVYISMAFGNPYGDHWDTDEVLTAMENIADLDIRTMSLADTVGLATPEQVAALVAPAVKSFHPYEVGVHLHSTRDGAADKVLAAWDAGCRRFDAAIGGLGGCPFAQNDLVGNIPTESLLEALQKRGEMSPVKPLDKLLELSAGIDGEYGMKH
jgi:hydroxymethylglutaryl-CoA lyase